MHFQTQYQNVPIRININYGEEMHKCFECYFAAYQPGELKSMSEQLRKPINVRNAITSHGKVVV